MKRAHISTELGKETQCSKCGEFWPADGEFFYTSKGALHSWCKACYSTSPCMVAKKERWLASRRKTTGATPASKPAEAPLRIDQVWIRL